MILGALGMQIVDEVGDRAVRTFQSGEFFIKCWGGTCVCWHY